MFKSQKKTCKRRVCDHNKGGILYPKSSLLYEVCYSSPVSEVSTAFLKLLLLDLNSEIYLIKGYSCSCNVSKSKTLNTIFSRIDPK